MGHGHYPKAIKKNWDEDWEKRSCGIAINVATNGFLSNAVVGSEKMKMLGF